MLRRRDDHRFWLVSQAEHARVALELAEHFGNPTFAAPMPRAGLLRAVELHDAGWSDADQQPALNHAGQPLDAFEMPLQTSLAIWSLSSRHALAAGPYAALLVSLHGLMLSTHAEAESTALNFALNRFQHAQIELQESLRKELGMKSELPLKNGLAPLGRSAEEDLLLANFQLLQLADRLSLNICFDEARFDSIEPVFAQAGGEPVSIRVAHHGQGMFSVNPWPFDQDRLKLRLCARGIPLREYPNNEMLRREFVAAGEEEFAVRLTPEGALPA